MLFVRSLLQTLAEKYVFRVVKPVKNLENAKKITYFDHQLDPLFVQTKNKKSLTQFIFSLSTQNKIGYFRGFWTVFLNGLQSSGTCVCATASKEAVMSAIEKLCLSSSANDFHVSLDIIFWREGSFFNYVDK